MGFNDGLHDRQQLVGVRASDVDRDFLDVFQARGHSQINRDIPVIFVLCA